MVHGFFDHRGRRCALEPPRRVQYQRPTCPFAAPTLLDEARPRPRLPHRFHRALVRDRVVSRGVLRVGGTRGCVRVAAGCVPRRHRGRRVAGAAVLRRRSVARVSERHATPRSRRRGAVRRPAVRARDRVDGRVRGHLAYRRRGRVAARRRVSPCDPRRRARRRAGRLRPRAHLPRQRRRLDRGQPLHGHAGDGLPAAMASDGAPLVRQLGHRGGAAPRRSKARRTARLRGAPRGLRPRARRRRLQRGGRARRPLCTAAVEARVRSREPLQGARREQERRHHRRRAGSDLRPRRL